jgi:citrate synthase
MAEWIGAAEAAERLGIKRASLYSYVSRGVLTRRRGDGGRGSLFDAAEVEGLARRGRPRRAPGRSELIIESALTEITGDRLRFRGLDAIALAGAATFEDVAALLWTGSWDGAGRSGPWQATREAVAAASAAQAALPAHTLPLERLQVIVPAMAATDPLRLQLDRPAVIAAARSMIAGMADSLPAAAGLFAGLSPAAGSAREPAAVPRAPAPAPTAGPGAASGTIAERLATRLCPQPLRPGLTDALRAALVLLTDHELAASTLAARVAASVRADPYAVVATGLGAVGGALHGGASLGAEVMLASATGPDDAARVVGDLLRRGEKIPGFGHFVYKAGDPRAVLLLTLIRRAAPQDPRLAVAQAVVTEARRRALPEPNIDFALAVLASVGGMIRGASEAVFAVARTAGWLAHAIEEYARDTPTRPRGIYPGRAAPGR